MTPQELAARYLAGEPLREPGDHNPHELTTDELLAVLNDDAVYAAHKAAHHHDGNLTAGSIARFRKHVARYHAARRTHTTTRPAVRPVQRAARPRERRAGASSSTSGSDPGASDSDPEPPPLDTPTGLGDTLAAQFAACIAWHDVAFCPLWAAWPPDDVLLALAAVLDVLEGEAGYRPDLHAEVVSGVELGSPELLALIVAWVGDERPALLDEALDGEADR